MPSRSSQELPLTGSSLNCLATEKPEENGMNRGINPIHPPHRASACFVAADRELCRWNRLPGD